MISVLLLGGHKEALQSSNVKNLLLCPVTRVTANKVCYLTKHLVYGKLLHYKLSIHIASTGISVKIKQRKGNFTLVMHLMCDFCRNVTRVTMEWLVKIICKTHLCQYRRCQGIKNTKKIEGI